ncbi:toprim domain-containing protein [Empedobacter falsenii]|uniref:toprim domain-containing protein n=1 Tax=Empedobacter falsenii TaxID=343874 RepID=UPI00257550A9|nr:toprim domain-containing protein [Empedobacter falsenii]MDM1299844.1 toprim domain-containing protein [Empedobacter falsenii]MDM1319654.1 toprim domain-containing protein [Empedobacter falsenii]
MNCKTINEKIRMIDYLAQKDIYPISSKQNVFWFLSPFRNEKTASFKVDNSTNRFYDFGEGFGGTLIDLISKLEKLSIKEIIQKFNENSFSFQKQNDFQFEKNQTRNKYEILELKEISSFPLIQYLEERKLPLEIVKRYCKEIHYKLNDKKYYAIAFPNVQNGFEIRNKYVKMCLVKKDISLIKNNQNQLKTFESWSDFISYLFLFPTNEFESDFLILNSIALLRKNIELINKYESIQTYFDHDDAGKSTTNILETELKTKVKDDSNFYKNYKDLNEFIITKNIV